MIKGLKVTTIIKPFVLSPETGSQSTIAKKINKTK